MAEVFLVRHGQASLDAVNYDQLTTVGQRQSQRLGRYFASRRLRFDFIFAGGMRRHAQTVHGIMEGMGADHPCIELVGLNEYDFEALFIAASMQWPEFGNMSRGSQKEYFLGLKRVLFLWSEGKIDAPIPERWDEFQRRVADSREYVQKNARGRVLVVSSGGVIGAMTQQILGAPAAAAIELNQQIFNSSLSRYLFNAERCSLASFNNLPHLDDEIDRHLVTYG